MSFSRSFMPEMARSSLAIGAWLKISGLPGTEPDCELQGWKWKVPTGARMNLTDHHGYLAVSTVFRGKLCEQLSSRSTRHIPAGQTIYTTADPGDSVYFLRSGLVKTSVISEKGKELLLTIYTPGATFGELCFCGGQRREQAVAMEGSEVVEFFSMIWSPSWGRAGRRCWTCLMQYVSGFHKRMIS